MLRIANSVLLPVEGDCSHDKVKIPGDKPPSSSESSSSSGTDSEEEELERQVQSLDTLARPSLKLHESRSVRQVGKDAC